MKTESVIAGIVMFVLVAVITASGIAAYRYKSAIDRAATAESQVTLQDKVIQAQQSQQMISNAIAMDTAHNNQTVQVGSDHVVVQYREVLRREKTCDYAVPADIANGLLSYANRLRSGIVSAATSQPDSTSVTTITTGQLTYCQAVLWINPLLSAIDQANNQLSAIRQIEQHQGK